MHALRRITKQNTRQAERYREGPILLLGDAAHVHAGIGHLGSTSAPGRRQPGLEARLGYLAGWAPPGLLDTYHTERHPAGQRVAMSTRAQTGLMLPGPELTALRHLLGELLDTRETVQHIANLMAGPDIRYDTGHPHPLSGRMVPEATSPTANGPRRVAEVLHRAWPVLLDLTRDEHLGTTSEGWSDRVDTVCGASAVLPAAAILIRPDGYVAWASDQAYAADRDLPDALAHSFGAPKVLAEWTCPADPTAQKRPWPHDQSDAPQIRHRTRLPARRAVTISSDLGQARWR